MILTLDDTEAALPIFSEVCSHCEHWIRKPGRKCHAFPDGIPFAIWVGENSHRTAFPGDHGIQFAPVSDGVAAEAELRQSEEAIGTGRR